MALRKYGKRPSQAADKIFVPAVDAGRAVEALRQLSTASRI
ncbi:hypothetical protein FHT78_001270 [Rhizobium sp. BK196]|jgi:hypothetical protein|nr:MULTISPECIES: hypothetical protein [unclassified Rhizobium]MBB3309541.1 hypothetical protein [Rhizobium sp. BK196]MBB3465129.1 hypothetical protein [Rhizobium sp. BK377]